jgi:single-strand DNA-binding protein
MSSLNCVHIIGNMCQDPEVKETQSGNKVATFSVATNRSFKDKSGVKQDEVQFHNIVLWNSAADFAEKYIKKGNKVYIQGRLQTRTWDDQSGKKLYKTEIVADQFTSLTPKDQTKKEEIDIADVPF